MNNKHIVMSCKCRFCGSNAHYRSFRNKCGEYFCKNKKCASFDYSFVVSFKECSIILENFFNEKWDLTINYKFKTCVITLYSNTTDYYPDLFNKLSSISDINKIDSIINNFTILS